MDRWPAFMGEGSRPLFARPEIEVNKYNQNESEPSLYEHACLSVRGEHIIPGTSNSHGRQMSGELIRTSYIVEEQHGNPCEFGRPREYVKDKKSFGFNSQERSREEHFKREDDLRLELELRRRDTLRNSNGGNIQMREKRSEYRDDLNRVPRDLRMKIRRKYSR